jgi:glycerophosphoryl diester phosphodiesterase
MLASMVPILLVYIVAIQAYSPITIPPRNAYPQVISHRGASGYVPEHSIAAYQLAMDLMTDYVETDLVLSKDGIFHAMHDLTLDNTTNVADFPEWATRKTTRTIDGSKMTGYFVSDFTTTELKQIRLKQRLYQRPTVYNLFFTIPTLNEIMETMQSNYNKTQRTVGLYIEIKKPSYSRGMGFDIERMLLDSLSKAGYHVYENDPQISNDMMQVNPIVYECFDRNSLEIMQQLSSIPQVLLLEKQSNDFWTPEAMKEISLIADGIGPEKSFLENATYTVAYDRVQMIYSSKLRIHPWTFRADQDIGVNFADQFDSEEMYFYCCLGMDAVFTEFPDRARETIDILRGSAPMKNYANTKCPIDCEAYGN